MRQLLVIFSISLLCAISACSSRSYFADAENALDTAGYFNLLDHISVYYPSGIALNFPGYIVGFEESSSSNVTNDRNDVLLDESVYAAGYTIKLLTKYLRYNVPFVSHVVRYEGRPYGEGNCTLYSLYHNHGNTVMNSCDNDPRNGVSADNDYRHAFAASWNAIELLKRRLSVDVASNRYTHLVVAVMGLDTPEEDAIRNYRSLVSSVRGNAGSSFEPLFVGITWPSFFANRWFDPMWEIFAYSPIADRADMLGLSWLGVLFNEAILPLSDRIEVDVIAHSFGARAASMALCVGPAIMRDRAGSAGRQQPGQVEDFIGLAPAFSLRRFIDEDPLFYENVYYSDYCPKIRRFVFTASSNDNAFSPIFWSSPVGAHSEMVDFCRQEHPVTAVCTSVDADGIINNIDDSPKISYIDTSALMKYRVPGTKGTGHSDIYRPEIGRFLWTLINGSPQ